MADNAHGVEEKKQPEATYEPQDLLPNKVASRGYPHRYTNIHEPIQEEHLGHPIEYELVTSFFLLRVFVSILDWSAFAVMMVTLGATFLCMNYNWNTDMPLTLLAAGMIFPISFGIDFALGRRENLLLDLASIKASCISLYYLYRDWELAFPKPKRIYSEDMKRLLDDLLDDISEYMEHRGNKERLYRIYQTVDIMARVHDELRREADWVRSVLSRNYQYERLILQDFERVRVIRDFRTPGVVRSFLLIFMYLFPVMLSPMFANYGLLYGYWAGIFTSLVSSFMLVSLLRVQVNVEDPFDELGTDDINLGLIKEVSKHMYPIERVQAR